jgi:hypothetical protein
MICRIADVFTKIPVILHSISECYSLTLGDTKQIALFLSVHYPILSREVRVKKSSAVLDSFLPKKLGQCK